MENNTIAIDSYLQNEMTAAERLAFENKLANDKDLQAELHLQQQMISAVVTAGLKNEFARSISKRILVKQLLRWGIVIAVAAAAAAAIVFYIVKPAPFNQNSGEAIKQGASYLPAPEIFTINTAADTIIETNDGVVFAIPAHAFNSSKEQLQLQIRTALEPLDIMRYGLSTVSNESLLQTAGMFSVNGLDDGKVLELTKEIAVSIPAKEINPDMQLFDGEGSSDGTISWVNPRPIPKTLRTYDISQLDFYPPRYISTLKALGKDYQDKKYTDSLYYSFSGYPRTLNPQPKQSVALVPVDIEKNNFSTPDTSKFLLDSSVSIQPDRYYEGAPYQIDPAKIKAIWDKQFNNTIIATKEFEERLRCMHGLCRSGYLEAYLQNLGKPLYKTDELLAAKSEGTIRQQFLEFAKRKDGTVMIAAGLQQKLSNYFYKRSKAYSEAVAKTWARYQDSLDRLNRIADEKQRAAAISDFKRENSNFKQELCANLTDAYRQIGINRNCDEKIVTAAAAKYYNVTISTAGWKNLDVYVTDATINRQRMAYTDPNTGKTATLTYKEVNISIENREQYDKVFVYLLPDGLSSFQRVKEQQGNFKENLNALFKYDAVVLAYKGDQAYFFRQQLLQPNTYVFRLTAYSKEALQAALKSYSTIKATELNNDVEYQLFSLKEIERQVQLRKEIAFREQIASSIFTCGEGGFVYNESTKH